MFNSKGVSKHNLDGQEMSKVTNAGHVALLCGQNSMTSSIQLFISKFQKSEHLDDPILTN